MAACVWLRVGWSGARLVRQMVVGHGGRRQAVVGHGGRRQAADGGQRSARAADGRPQVADRGRPGGPADASDLPLQQHQRRKGAGYAARAAM